eukprot:2160227-Pleurochrysis_carterae.AAC.2
MHACVRICAPKRPSIRTVRHAFVTQVFFSTGKVVTNQMRPQRQAGLDRPKEKSRGSVREHMLTRVTNLRQDLSARISPQRSVRGYRRKGAGAGGAAGIFSVI